MKTQDCLSRAEGYKMKFSHTKYLLFCGPQLQQLFQSTPQWWNTEFLGRKGQNYFPAPPQHAHAALKYSSITYMRKQAWIVTKGLVYSRGNKKLQVKRGTNLGGLVKLSLKLLYSRNLTMQRRILLIFTFQRARFCEYFQQKMIALLIYRLHINLHMHMHKHTCTAYTYVYVKLSVTEEKILLFCLLYCSLQESILDLDRTDSL